VETKLRFHFSSCLDSVICFGFLDALLNYRVFDYGLLHQGLTPVQHSAEMEQANKEKICSMKMAKIRKKSFFV